MKDIIFYSEQYSTAKMGLCSKCQHLLTNDYPNVSCKAFDVIPDEIVLSVYGNNHEDIKKNQKGNFVFTQKQKQS